MKWVTRRYIKFLEEGITGRGKKYHKLWGPVLPYLSPFRNDWEWGARNEWVKEWCGMARIEIQRLSNGAEITKQEVAAKAAHDVADYEAMMGRMGEKAIHRWGPDTPEIMAQLDRELGDRTRRLLPGYDGQ